ncbi:hypothetical protein [Actinomadura kijaniata]|uniref:hypothetical protein n=1 Tax=Actinomadura kijaniata TaxID=46161 RepID=UPI000829EA9E|nr:hypothetical protein [Actinomadura kijaniata]
MAKHKIGVLLTVLLLAGGCAMAGATPSGAFRPGEATAPPRPASPVSTPRGDGSPLGRYRLFHEVIEYTLETGDPRRVPAVATGPAAARLLDRVRRNHRAGVVQRGHAVPRPTLTALREGPGHGAGTAEIVDCVTASGPWTYRARTGERVGPAPRPRRHLVHATLTKAHGIWKVAALTIPRNARC